MTCFPGRVPQECTINKQHHQNLSIIRNNANNKENFSQYLCASTVLKSPKLTHHQVFVDIDGIEAKPGQYSITVRTDTVQCGLIFTFQSNI